MADRMADWSGEESLVSLPGEQDGATVGEPSDRPDGRSVTTDDVSGPVGRQIPDSYGLLVTGPGDKLAAVGRPSDGLVEVIVPVNLCFA